MGRKDAVVYMAKSRDNLDRKDKDTKEGISSRQQRDRICYESLWARKEARSVYVTQSGADLDSHLQSGWCRIYNFGDSSTSHICLESGHCLYIAANEDGDGDVSDRCA